MKYRTDTAEASNGDEEILIIQLQTDLWRFTISGVKVVCFAAPK